MKKGKYLAGALAFLGLIICTSCGNGEMADTKVATSNQVSSVMDSLISQSTEASDTVEGTSDAILNQEGSTPLASVSEEKQNEEEHGTEDTDIDIDISAMGSDMVYATVYQMMTEPNNYIDKKIRIKGTYYSVFYEPTGLTYHYVMIQDAAACCQQGMEFVLTDGAEYPAEQTEVTVTGTFETYYEGEYLYCTLKDAVIGS